MFWWKYEDEGNLLENLVEINIKSRPKTKDGKMNKINTFDSVNTRYKSRESTLNAFQKENISIKYITTKRVKLVTPKQMLQGLATVNTQIKAGKTSENIINENGGIIWSLLKAKEITTIV